MVKMERYGRQIICTGLAAAALAGLFGCKPAPEPSANAPAASENAPAVADSSSLPVGEPVTNFSLKGVNGGTVSLSDYGGKVRLITFWSVTCVPCIQELPALKSIYGKYKGQGFEVIYLSADRLEVQKPFLKKREVPFPSAVATNQLLELYKVSALPKMVLVDGEGRVLKEYLGETEAETLETDVKAALAQVEQ